MHIIQISNVPVSLSTLQGHARSWLPSQWLVLNRIALPYEESVMVDGLHGIVTIVVSVDVDNGNCCTIEIGEDVELAYDVIFPRSDMISGFNVCTAL